MTLWPWDLKSRNQLTSYFDTCWVCLDVQCRDRVCLEVLLVNYCYPKELQEEGSNFQRLRVVVLGYVENVGTPFDGLGPTELRSFEPKEVMGLRRHSQHSLLEINFSVFWIQKIRKTFIEVFKKAIKKEKFWQAMKYQTFVQFYLSFSC